MSKTTKELWDEFCEKSHSSNPGSWIIVGPNLAKKLKKLKKEYENGRKRDKSR